MASMITPDNVVVTVPEIVELFGVSLPAVRRWIAAGILCPVARKAGSQGRGGVMLFARGDVSSLVYGQCRACGNGYKRTSTKQAFCSKSCRQKWSRRVKVEPPAAGCGSSCG